MAGFQWPVTIDRLVDLLEAGSPDWKGIDELVYDIYDLTDGERILVSDVHNYERPCAKSAKAAEAPPTDAVMKVFCERLKYVIAPRGGQKVEPIANDLIAGWRFIHIHPDGWSNLADNNLLSLVEQVIEPLDVSQIRIDLGDKGGVLLGQLAETRYWTRSRAWHLGLEWRRTRLKPGRR